MTASVHLDRGQGPVVVLLHGVGVGPESFATLAGLLEDHHRVIVLDRPGGGAGGPLPLVDQVDLIAARIWELGAAGGRLVGVSGGATLGLLLAIRHPGAVAGLVLHEPLVGPLAPELHQRFQRSAAQAARSDAEAMTVVRAVMGEPTWTQLSAEAQAAAEAQAPRWRAEIASFAAFAPTDGELRSLRGTPLLITIGGRSDPARSVAAHVLQDRCGAELAVIPGAGNAVHLDAPDAFAHVLASWQTIPTGDR